MTLFPYIRKEMNHLTVEGARFAERTGGIGDIELRGMYSVFDTQEPRQWLLLNGGVGLPTGSIDATMDGMPLEYPMQIGSGTFSLLPGVTYLGQVLPWGWAADFGSTVRVGRNDNGYRLGDRYQLGVSITRQLEHSVSVSAGARGEWWGNIRGSDAMLDPTDEPTKDLHRSAFAPPGRGAGRAVVGRPATTKALDLPVGLAAGILILRTALWMTRLAATDPCAQLRELERLRRIVIGAAVEAAYAIVHDAARRQHEDCRNDVSLPELATDDECVQSRSVVRCGHVQESSDQPPHRDARSGANVLFGTAPSGALN